MFCRFTPVVSAFALLGLSTAVFAQALTLPGGAASLREAHGDWTVACALQPAEGIQRKVCALAQEQLAANTRQRALAIELKPDAGSAKGTLVLPFGLALNKGVRFVLDDGEAGDVQRFRTCLPIGCMIDVVFDAGTIKALRSGKVLKVNAAADGGREMSFSISLTGFAGAYDRTAALVK